MSWFLFVTGLGTKQSLIVSCLHLLDFLSFFEERLVPCTCTLDKLISASHNPMSGTNPSPMLASPANRTLGFEFPLLFEFPFLLKPSM